MIEFFRVFFEIMGVLFVCVSITAVCICIGLAIFGEIDKDPE